MNPVLLAKLAAWLLIVFVFAFVYGQRRGDALGRGFLLFTAVSGIWVFLELLQHVPAFAGSIDTMLRIIGFIWVPVGYLFLNFAYALVDRPRDAIHHAVLALSLAGACVTPFTDWVYQGYHWSEYSVIDERDPLRHSLLAIVPTIASLYGLGLVLRRWMTTADARARGPLTLVLLGGVVTLTSAVTMNAVLPNLLGMSDFPRLGSAAMALFIFLIYLAVRRYDFLAITVEGAAEELFDRVHDGIVLFDATGRPTRMNDTARRILAVGDEDPTRVDVARALPGYRPDADYHSLEITLGSSGLERTFVLSQSTRRAGDVSLGKFLVIHEATEQHRAEQVLRLSRDELVAEARERAEQVVQAQKMEAVGTMAAGIVRDFSNLLTSILAFAGAARDDLGREHPLSEDLEEVLGAARRAEDLVQRILAFSPGNPEERQTLRAGSLVDEALKLISISAPPTVAIRREVAEGPVYVTADPVRLHQVLMNLCTNAVHSMREGGGELRVALETVEVDGPFALAHPPLVPGPHARITVADTGCGMTAEILSQVFDPFFTTREPGRGTGLGLAMVQHTVNDHEGTILVESDPGRGTVFQVLLPVSERDSRPPDSEIGELPRGVEQILWVDHDEVVVRAAGRMLEPLGYRVVGHTDAMKALAALEESPGAFDAAVTGQAMPAMSGVDLARRLTGLRRDLPVILAADNDSSQLRAQATAVGVRMVIVKPLTREKLAAEIREALDR